MLQKSNTWHCTGETNWGCSDETSWSCSGDADNFLVVVPKWRDGLGL